MCLTFSYGQERVNRVKLSFDKEGEILTKFTGWAYNDKEGEWVEYANYIDDDKQNKKYKNIVTYLMSHRFNNIISLQFKTMTYNESLYYVLVWDKWTGSYKYPSIREDWSYWNSTMYMLFSEEEMQKLKNLTNEPISIIVPTHVRKEYSDYDETSDVDVIQSGITKKYQNMNSITIYKATDGSIRFLFGSKFQSIDTIKKQYFEISEADYLKLINI